MSRQISVIASKRGQIANEDPQPDLKKFDDIYDRTEIDNSKLIVINDLMKNN
jgi:hypothetical protein